MATALFIRTGSGLAAETPAPMPSWVSEYFELPIAAMNKQFKQFDIDRKIDVAVFGIFIEPLGHTAPGVLAREPDPRRVAARVLRRAASRDSDYAGRAILVVDVMRSVLESDLKTLELGPSGRKYLKRVVGKLEPRTRKLIAEQIGRLAGR